MQLSGNVDERAVREHVAGIISSSQFAGAPRLAKFLTFVVETALDGRADQIKESLIAIEVYGRRPDYNPQVDSTVRVEAGRLRARLRQYYEAHGVSATLEIELPKGTYAPVFRPRTVESEPVPVAVPRPRPVRPGAIASLILAGVVFAGLVCYGRIYARSEPSAVADAKANELYLRAYELLRLPILKNGVVTEVPASVYESVRLFEEVTRRSPRFSRGWVGLAEANEWLYELDKGRPPERLLAAKAAVRRAIELEPNLPEAWTILTSLLFFREWDIPGAEAACRRAIELNPRDTIARQRLVDLLRIQGRLDEAMREVTHAASLQPSAPNLRNRKAILLLDSGQLDAALKEAATAESLNPSKQQPSYSNSVWIQAVVHQRQGNLLEAEDLYRKGIQVQPHDLWSEPSLGHLLGLTNRKTEALEILNELQRQLALGRPQHRAIALVLLGLGLQDEAIHWLDRAFVERDTAVLFIAHDWRFASLQAHPRFQTLLARIRRASAPRLS